ncbi:hypothetical protein ABT185_23925 [Streptomyces clavifer]|uniref:hypothetical protein n=1 Tax=Streptomyces clavifer TaxID=68188 RepID=UPI00332A8CD7
MTDGNPPSSEDDKNFPHRSQHRVQVKGHDRLAVRHGQALRTSLDGFTEADFQIYLSM